MLVRPRRTQKEGLDDETVGTCIRRGGNSYRDGMVQPGRGTGPSGRPWTMSGARSHGRPAAAGSVRRHGAVPPVFTGSLAARNVRTEAAGASTQCSPWGRSPAPRRPARQRSRTERVWLATRAQAFPLTSVVTAPALGSRGDDPGSAARSLAHHSCPPSGRRFRLVSPSAELHGHAAHGGSALRGDGGLSRSGRAELRRHGGHPAGVLDAALDSRPAALQQVAQVARGAGALRGCIAGNGPACEEVVRSGRPEDRTTARAQLRVLTTRACDGGDGKACNDFATILVAEGGAQADVDAAWTKACDKNVAHACLMLANTAATNPRQPCWPRVVREGVHRW